MAEIKTLTDPNIPIGQSYNTKNYNSLQNEVYYTEGNRYKVLKTSKLNIDDNGTTDLVNYGDTHKIKGSNDVNISVECKQVKVTPTLDISITDELIGRGGVLTESLSNVYFLLNDDEKQTFGSTQQVNTVDGAFGITDDVQYLSSDVGEGGKQCTTATLTTEVNTEFNMEYDGDKYDGEINVIQPISVVISDYKLSARIDPDSKFIDPEDTDHGDITGKLTFDDGDTGSGSVGDSIVINKVDDSYFDLSCLKDINGNEYDVTEILCKNTDEWEYGSPLKLSSYWKPGTASIDFVVSGNGFDETHKDECKISYLTGTFTDGDGLTVETRNKDPEEGATAIISGNNFTAIGIQYDGDMTFSEPFVKDSIHNIKLNVEPNTCTFVFETSVLTSTTATYDPILKIDGAVAEWGSAKEISALNGTTVVETEPNSEALAFTGWTIETDGPDSSETSSIMTFENIDFNSFKESTLSKGGTYKITANYSEKVVDVKYYFIDVT